MCKEKPRPDRRRQRACLREMRTKKESKNERSRHKVRNKDCVWPRKIQNVEVDNDVFEVAALLPTLM